MKNDTDLIAHLHINPMVVVGLGQFRFLSALLLVSVIIVLFWHTYLDYLLTYEMGDLFLSSAYQMIVANGQHFRKLNFRRLNWADWRFSWWCWWRFPDKYFALGKQILNSSKELCSIFAFNLKFKPLFWPICFSSQTLGRLYVYSAVFELIVVFVCVFVGKVYWFAFCFLFLTYFFN